MSRFVVYHGPTTLYLSTWLARNKLPHRFLKTDHYATYGAARAALTRAKKALAGHSVHWLDFSVLDEDFFSAYVEEKEIRHGIVGCKPGATFEVGVNTPWTSGPWSETYWSS